MKWINIQLCNHTGLIISISTDSNITIITKRYELVNVRIHKVFPCTITSQEIYVFDQIWHANKPIDSTNTHIPPGRRELPNLYAVSQIRLRNGIIKVGGTFYFGLMVMDDLFDHIGTNVWTSNSERPQATQELPDLN